MQLAVEQRTPMGKKVKLLRQEQKVPGVVYGKHLDAPLHVALEKLALVKAYNQAGMSTALQLEGDGISELVLIQDMKLDPVTDVVLHVDFLAVQKDKKVTADVPVVLSWTPQIEKAGLGSVQQLLTHLEVEAFPMDLPHDIQVDVTWLDHPGMVIHVSDITVADNVEIITDKDAAVATAVAFVEEKEEEETEGLMAEGAGETADGETAPADAESTESDA